MSFSIHPKNGVRLKTVRRHGIWISAVIIALEAFFSFFLYLSLAERIFVITPASASYGVPEYISYQGMLTDTSGNPLGGAGSVYCFQYSIWDSQSGGNQLWPAGTPGNSTTTVTDGVFSDQLGRVDSLSSLDFESTSTYYLQVAVSTSSLTCASGLETLSPRQQIVSDAWSQTAQSVFGSQLQAGGPLGNEVQIGNPAIGHSSTTVTLLSLSMDNSADEAIGGSCSINGTLWYDSTIKRALVCEQGSIVPISNEMTVEGNGITGSSTIFGPILSAGANITFATGGQTITINGAAGGGGATLVQFEPYPLLNTVTTSFLPAAKTWFIEPFVAPDYVGPGQLNILVSNATLLSVLPLNSVASFASGSLGSFSESYAFSQMAALYSRTAGGSSIGSFWSSNWGISITESVSVVSTSAGSSYVSVNASATLSYPLHMDAAGGVTYSSFTASSARSSASTAMSSSALTTGFSSMINILAQNRQIPVPFNTTLPPGQYFLAQAWSTVSAGNGISADLASRVNQIALSMYSLSFKIFNSTASNSSVEQYAGIGEWANASAAPPSTMNLTDIRNSWIMPYFNIQENTF